MEITVLPNRQQTVTVEDKIQSILATLSQSSEGCNKDSSNGKCPICNDNYWIINDKGNAVRCKCYEQVKINNRLRFANIPDAFKDMQLNTFNTAVYKKPESKMTINTVVASVKLYLENFEEMQKLGKGLYFFSDTKGSGKTRLAASIANKLLQEHQVKFATSISILNEIKRTYDKESDLSESKLLDDLIMTEILIIDDFGTESYSTWVGEKFYHIINSRYIDKKVTIYTSNFELDKLQHDTRVTNRIKEQAFQIRFPEESIRDYIAKDNTIMLAKKIMCV